VPVEVTTDKAPAYLRVLGELVPAALHLTEQYSNNRVKRLRSAAVIATGHAFVQNVRRGHYELATDVAQPYRLAAAFTELALARSMAVHCWPVKSGRAWAPSHW